MLYTNIIEPILRWTFVRKGFVLLHAACIAFDVFVHNGEDAYGLPPYPTLASSLSKWNDEDLHIREAVIISDALKYITTMRLRDPNYGW